jgi:DNA-binding CsgD family transcriptional regulator
VVTVLKHALGWGQDNPAFRQLFTSFFLPEGTLEQFRWFNDLQRVSSSPDNAAKFFREFLRINVCEQAAQVRVPTLVLHAQEDASIPFNQGRMLAALIPNAKFVPLHSKNHILLEEEVAWQRFLSEVHEFLDDAQPIPTDPHKPQASSTELSRPTSEIESQLAAQLTDREQEILELIAQGLSNTQIGDRLVISPKTVRNHITSIFSKMQVATRAEAIVQARNAGFGT